MIIKIKTVLVKKLKNTKMNESNTMASYLTRILQVEDEHGVVGIIVPVEDLVRTALSKFSKPWATFVTGVLA